jgi:hypothetical protein
MSGREPNADDTQRTVQGRYDAWRTDNPPPPRQPALDFSDGIPIPELSPEAGRVVFTAIGVGIGLTLLVLAVLAFHTSATWAHVGRDGAQVGWFLVGCFLTIAGLGGTIASYNHNYRVMMREGGDH